MEPSIQLHIRSKSFQQPEINLWNIREKPGIRDQLDELVVDNNRTHVNQTVLKATRDIVDKKVTVKTIDVEGWTASGRRLYADLVVTIEGELKDLMKLLQQQDFTDQFVPEPKAAENRMIKSLFHESVSSDAREAEPPKSPEQAEAGNYKLGHTRIFGLDISIENPKGSTRSGVGRDGKEWSVKLPAHYGYIKGTVGRDKDHLDVYLGPHEKSELVVIVNQGDIDKPSQFDEHKIMLCFYSRAEAIKAYDNAFTGDIGPKLRKDVQVTDVVGLKEWLSSGNTKKPFKL